MNDACGIPVFNGTYRVNGTTKDEPFSIDFKNPKSFEDTELDRPYYVSDRRDNGIFIFDAITFDCSGTLVKFPRTTLGPFTLAVSSVPV